MVPEATSFPSTRISASLFSLIFIPGLYGYNDYLRYRDLHMVLCTVRLDEIETHQSPGKLVDVGCGPGVLLDSARARGWEVSGLDLSSYAVEIARSYYNLSIVEGEFLEADFPNEHFDVVNLLSAEESDTRPRDTLEIAGRRVEATSAAIFKDRARYWPWVLAVAILLLLVEWYCYHRR